MKQPHKKYAEAKRCLLTAHSGYKVWKGVPFDDAREQIYVTEDHQTYPAGTNAWGVDYPAGEKRDAIVWTCVSSVEDANCRISKRKLQNSLASAS